jgi:hypothetical protein
MSTDPFDGVQLPTTGSSNEIGQPTFVELIWADECLTSPAVSGKTPNTNTALNQLAFGKDCIDKLAPITPGDFSIDVVDNQLLPKDVNKPIVPDAEGSLPASDSDSSSESEGSGGLGSTTPQVLKYSLSDSSPINFKAQNTASEFESLIFNPFSDLQGCSLPLYDLDCGTEECMVDAVFCIDTSGSMGSSIAAVGNAAAQMAALIKQVSGSSYRLGLYSIGHSAGRKFFTVNPNTNTVTDAVNNNDSLTTARIIQPIENNKIIAPHNQGILTPLISLSPGKAAFLSNPQAVGSTAILSSIYDLPVAGCDNLAQFERWINIKVSGGYEPMHQICDAISSDGQNITASLFQPSSFPSFLQTYRPRSQSSGKVLFLVHDEYGDIDFARMRQKAAVMANCGWTMLAIFTASTIRPEVIAGYESVFEVIGGTYVHAPQGQNMYELSTSFILSTCTGGPPTDFECPVGVNYIKNGTFETSIANWDDVSNQRGIPDRNVGYESSLAALDLSGAAKQDINQQLAANEKIVLNFNAALKPESSGTLSATPAKGGFDIPAEKFKPPVSKSAIMPQIINPDSDPEAGFSGVGLVGSTTGAGAYASIETTNLDVTEAISTGAIDFQVIKRVQGDIFTLSSDRILRYYENTGVARDSDIRDVDLTTPTNTFDLSADLGEVKGLFVFVDNNEQISSIYINGVSTSSPGERIVKYALSTPGDLSTLSLASDLSTDGDHGFANSRGICIVGNEQAILICHGSSISQFNTTDLTLLSTLSANSTRTFNSESELGLTNGYIQKICVAQVDFSDDPSNYSNTILRQAYYVAKEPSSSNSKSRLIRGNISTNESGTWDIEDLGIEEGREFGNGLISFSIDGIADILDISGTASISYRNTVKHWTLQNAGSSDEINQRLSQKVEYFCTCSAIHDNLVLSAAHCLAPSGSSTPINPNTARITFKAKTYRCDDIRIHPDYLTKTDQNIGDISLVRVIGQIDNDVDQYGLSASSSTIYPAFIDTKDDASISVVGNDVKIVGYGNTGIQDNTTQQLFLPSYGQKRSGNQQIDEVVNAFLRYTQGSGESAAYKGDSGGPMLDLIDGEYYIAGVVSYGTPPVSGGVGATGTVVSYVRTSYAESWLASNIADMSGRQQIFIEDWESYVCPAGEFRLYQDPGPWTSTGQFEIQNNIAGIGPAYEGQKHGELDGTNQIWTYFTTNPNNSYELDFYYSPRPGLPPNQNKIDVFWDEQFIVTIKDDGSSNTSTSWRRVRLSLPKPSSTNTRIMFASKEDPGFGAGGFLDYIRMFESSLTDGGGGGGGGNGSSGVLTYKILKLDGTELATDSINASDLNEAPNYTNLTLDATLTQDTLTQVLFTTEDGAEDNFIIDDVVACAQTDANCSGGANNLVTNGKFDNGVENWTNENGVPLDPTGDAWDPIIKALVFSLTTENEVRHDIVDTDSIGQTLFLSFEVVSLEPAVISELSFDYGILDKDGNVVKKATFTKQNNSIPITLELEFQPPSDGEFKVFFSTGSGISGTAKIRNVLICGAVGCEDGFSLVSKDTFENSTGGWSGGVWNQQEQYLELEKNADSFKSAAIQSFPGLTPLTTFRATFILLEQPAVSEVRIELTSGDDTQQLLVNTFGTYSIEIPVGLDGEVTAAVYNQDVNNSIALDLALCCQSDVLACDGSIDTINGILEWQGTPRVPVNIFNAFIKFKIRNPIDPFDVSEEIFEINAEGRLSVVTCDLWKSELGSSGILSKDIGNTSNIGDGDLINVETRSDWLWSIPQSGAATAAGQDNLVMFYDGPGPGKLVEKAELFILANRINPLPGTSTPKPYGCDAGDDPATTINMIIQYVNSENLNREFSQSISISELYPNDYDFTGFNWDDETATGNGYAGEVARWQSYAFELDLPNGKGIDQCTPPITSEESGVGNIILPKFATSGKGSFFDPCDADVLIEDTSGQAGFLNEIQRIIIPSSSSGTWDLVLNKDSVKYSSTLNWNVTKQELKTALEGFAPIGAGNVKVDGSGTDADPFLVEFVGALASTTLPLLESENVLLEGAVNAYVSTVVDGTTNERQKISNPADNRVDLIVTFDGEVSANIPYGSSLNDIQSALEGITAIGPGNVSVTGNITDRDAKYVNDYIIDFVGSLSGQNVPMLIVNPAYVSEVLWNGGVGANEQQRLTLNDVTSGTFTLTVSNQDGSDSGTTTALGYNESAGNIKSAIVSACSFITNADIDVEEIPSRANRYRHLITFKGSFAGLNMPSIKVDGTSLIGGLVDITRTQSGSGSNESQIVTILRATGGSFKLTVTVDGQDYQTTAIPWNTEAAGLEAQLEALPPFLENKGITVNSLELTNSEQNARFQVIFDKSYGNIPIMVAEYQLTLLCNPIVLPPVDPGPYEYELDKCDEIDDDLSCQSGPLLCKPGEGDEPVEQEICCTNENIPDRVNLSRRIKINRDLFSPNNPATIRDLATLKGLRTSEYTPYIRNQDNTLTETSFNLSVSTKMSIVLIKQTIDTNANQRRLKEYFAKKEMILPARFLWPECDPTATNAADDCWPNR